jgi:hypothetical protein
VAVFWSVVTRRNSRLALAVEQLSESPRREPWVIFHEEDSTVPSEVQQSLECSWESRDISARAVVRMTVASQSHVLARLFAVDSTVHVMPREVEE